MQIGKKVDIFYRIKIIARAKVYTFVYLISYNKSDSGKNLDFLDTIFRYNHNPWILFLKYQND